MDDIKKLSRYFRQSLIDSERLSPDDKAINEVLGAGNRPNAKASYLALPAAVLKEGCIEPELAGALVERYGSAVEPGKEKADDCASLVLYPRVDKRRYGGGVVDKNLREVLIPLGLFVDVNRDGHLTPGEIAPWVPREWLSPREEETETIGELLWLDDFFTHNPYDGVETWPQLLCYCRRLLLVVTGQRSSAIEFDPKKEIGSHGSIELLGGYERTGECVLQTEREVKGARRKIISTLQSLLDGARMPQLYINYCRQESPVLRPTRDLQLAADPAAAHLGQMSGEFPLSPKQRNALHHVIEQVDGEILAVNGPPGTGKTTLLRSVVANLWVQAALDQAKKPPLIVATSNNNQAITNILESFSKIDESDVVPALQGRWLNEVDSYGLYFCAQVKIKDNPYKYQWGEQGCMSGWEKLDYLERAELDFLAHAEQWLGEPVRDINVVRDQLHMAMCQAKCALVDGVTLVCGQHELRLVIEGKYEAEGDLPAAVDAAKAKFLLAGQGLAAAQAHFVLIHDLWAKRSLLTTLLQWLPSVRRRERQRTAQLLATWDLYPNRCDDMAVEQILREKVQRCQQLLAEAVKKQEAITNLQSHWAAINRSLNDWLQIHRPANWCAERESAQPVEEVADRVLRFRLFKLATHYWEARWLSATRSLVEKSPKNKSQDPSKVEEKLRHYAMLMPCFVSTFYTVPSVFEGYKRGKTKPLFSTIDFLIVDEAGQATPEVASACFALARRALIVGDTDQIEPVCRVPKAVDRANLQYAGLFGDEQRYGDFWLHSGLLASSGNLMCVAQRRCHYHQFEELQRGLYLTEHRRCYDSIIGYCNDLIYQGVLEPLRGESDGRAPWPTMLFQAVRGASETAGGSRGNPTEAAAIALWLVTERERIISYARAKKPILMDVSDSKVLEQSVGIVTPFRRQVKLIRSALLKQSIKDLKIGTVHRLQGDERLLVLFSSVYGEGDEGTTKFFDRSPSMLNVAVSRAKDVFVAFGHPAVFGTASSSSPSGLLRARLQ